MMEFRNDLCAVLDGEYKPWYLIGDLSPILEIAPEDTIIFDTETTGFKANGNDEILQISVVNGKGDVLFNDYVRPEHRRKWTEAEQVNHISWDMVKGKSTISELRDQLQAIFQSAKLIVGYNVKFDTEFISASNIFPNDSTIFFDVMIEYAPCYGTWNDYREDWKWQKLGTCARHYKFKFNAHDSLEDTLATRHCFYAMLQEKSAPGKTQMGYLEVVEKYGKYKKECREETIQKAVDPINKQAKAKATEEINKGELLEHDVKPASNKENMSFLFSVLLLIVCLPALIYIKLKNKPKWLLIPAMAIGILAYSFYLLVWYAAIWG